MNWLLRNEALPAVQRVIKAPTGLFAEGMLPSPFNIIVWLKNKRVLRSAKIEVRPDSHSQSPSGSLSVFTLTLAAAVL